MCVLRTFFKDTVLEVTVRYSKKTIYTGDEQRATQIDFLYSIRPKSCVITLRGTGTRRDSAWPRGRRGAAGRDGHAALQGPAARRPGRRDFHIEHKLSISSGVGVTIAWAPIDTSLNGLVGRVRPSVPPHLPPDPSRPSPAPDGPSVRQRLRRHGRMRRRVSYRPAREVGGRRAAPHRPGVGERGEMVW